MHKGLRCSLAMCQRTALDGHEKTTRFLSKTKRTVREKGIRYLLRAGALKIETRLSRSLCLYYFKVFKSWKSFRFQNKRYKYFYHKYNTTWKKMADAELDDLNLHELSHLYGTEDNFSKGDFMNAHVIDDLMSQNIIDNIFYRYQRLQADKQYESMRDGNSVFYRYQSLHADRLYISKGAGK